jgi:hypothetical protein
MKNINSLFSFNPYIKKEVIYNEEQIKFITSPLENCKLIGIPGGGKTESIIGKIIYHNLINDFLVLTFSKRACNDFIDKSTKYNNTIFHKNNISTFHSLAGKIIYEILEKQSKFQDTVIVSAIDLINNYPEQILKMHEFNNLKVVFIDEAQDISFFQYQFVLTISKLTQCKIILVGDPNQNIYQFQNGSDKYLLNHANSDKYLLNHANSDKYLLNHANSDKYLLNHANSDKYLLNHANSNKYLLNHANSDKYLLNNKETEIITYSLIKNYRSTPSIINFVNYFRPWTSLTEKMVPTKTDDKKKPFVFNGYTNEIIENIINKILNSPYKKEKIAIISPVKKSKMYNNTYINTSLELFIDHLDKNNIKYINHSENNDDNIIKKNHINLFTIHGAKGLEFDQVFLINFHNTTFGIVPSEEQYKEYKYLWYVGLSRASYDLNIYIDKNKSPWNELEKCNQELYDTNDKIIFKKISFSEKIIPYCHNLNEILNNQETDNITDQVLFDLENIFKYNVTKTTFFKNSSFLSQSKEYNKLHEQFIKNIFHYHHDKNNFLDKIQNIENNIIILQERFNQGYKLLKKRYPYITYNLIKLIDLNEIKNNFSKEEEELYSFISNYLNNNYNKEFFIELEKNELSNSKRDLLKLKDNKKNHKKIIFNIFKLTVYFYELNNDIIHINNIDFHLDYLKKYIDETILYARNFREDSKKESFNSNEIIKHSKLHITTKIDLKSNNKIINIIFSKELTIKHILEILLNYHIIDNTFKKTYNLEIVNFYSGEKYEITFDKKEVNIYKLLQILSTIINKKLENIIFFYHFHTTKDTYTNKKFDIIERHFQEFNLGIIPSRGLLKPQNMPFIPFELTTLTGINKELVDNCGDTIATFNKELIEIFKYCNEPTFITHNINSYDIKIFLNNKCKCIDSKNIIKLFLNDEISEKSLVEIFFHLFKYKPKFQRSEDNVNMLMSVFNKLNITEDKIINT